MLKNFFKKIIIQNDQRGFTLVEMIVAVTLGVAVVTIVGVVFVQTINLARRATAIQKLQENVSFIIESMAKEIRVSTIATANTACPTAPASILTISHPVNNNVEYSLTNNDVHRKLLDSGTDTTMNSSGTKIIRLGFCISGNSLSDQAQPRVTILLSAENSKGGETVSVDIQTTISQRFLSN